MKQIHLSNIFLFISILLFACTRQVEYDLVITNVALFDSEIKQVLPNKTILIRADTIVGIVNDDQKSSGKSCNQRQ